MTKTKVTVRSLREQPRWRIGQQWLPTPREAEVTADELTKLLGDPFLGVLVGDEVEVEDEPDSNKPSKPKGIPGFPGSGILARNGITTREALVEFITQGKKLADLEGMDEATAAKIQAKLEPKAEGE
jgi:hypothetical protein